MKSSCASFLMAMACLIACRGFAAEQEKTASTDKPCVSISGTDSKVTECEYHRITSEQDWTEIWKKHKGDKPDKESRNNMPVIDFDKFMVIAIFKGKGWNSNGLNVVSMAQEKDRIVIKFNNKSYQTWGPDGGGVAVIVYGFFVIPRSENAVTLEEDIRWLIQAPPVWTERITFPKL